MKTTLHKLVNKYNIPRAWLAELCGFTRTQVSNWVSQPDKYPIPEAKKMILQKKLNEIGKVFDKFEIM